MPLIAVIVGIVFGAVYVSRYTLTTYSRKFREQGKLVPEDRLPPMIVGAAVLPFGLFWFAWTSSPAITPWPQIVAGVPIGAGIQIITLQSLAYVLDIYSVDANSAVSGTVIVRSLLGGLFPLIAIPMYQNLGVCFCSEERKIRTLVALFLELINLPKQVQWASSVVGILASVFFTVPVILYCYGAKIRSWSKYVPRT